MTKYSKGEWTNARYDICEIECDGEIYCTVATKDVDLIIDVLNENEELKQFPIKLDNRIQKLKEDLKKLTEMDKSDLNPQAVEDVATVIGMSLNALMEFRKELEGDVE